MLQPPPQLAAESARRVVLVCHSPGFGGAESWLDQIIKVGADALARDCGARFELVCRSNPCFDAWCGSLAERGVPSHRVDLRDGRDVVRLAGLLKGAAVVHVNLAYPAGKYQAVAAVASRVLRRPLLVSHLLLPEPEQLGSAGWVGFMRALGRLGNAHIALSPYGKELLERRYGFPSTRITVIPTFVDTHLYRPLDSVDRTAIRHDWGRCLASEDWKGVRLIVTVARLTAQKGLFDLLEMAAMTATSEPKWRFVVAGQGELYDQLAARIGELGLRRRVFLAGSQPREQIARWLGAADLFVLPSHFEGLPLALLEAIACGCPVVATQVGSVRDLAIDTEVGRVVPPANPEALVAAAREVLATNHCLSVDEAVRRNLLGEYERDRCVQRAIELYGRLMEAGVAERRSTSSEGS